LKLIKERKGFKDIRGCNISHINHQPITDAKLACHIAQSNDQESTIAIIIEGDILIQRIELIPTSKSINTARQVYVASFNMMSESPKVENGIQKARALKSNAEMQIPNSHAGAHPSHSSNISNPL
jgi:hypothetical protein